MYVSERVRVGVRGGEGGSCRELLVNKTRPKIQKPAQQQRPSDEIKKSESHRRGWWGKMTEFVLASRVRVGGGREGEGGTLIYKRGRLHYLRARTRAGETANT